MHDTEHPLYEQITRSIHSYGATILESHHLYHHQLDAKHDSFLGDPFPWSPLRKGIHKREALTEGRCSVKGGVQKREVFRQGRCSENGGAMA